MATARPPGGDVPKATIGFDFSSLQRAPQVARQAAQATAREVTNAFKAAQREQATLEKQRMAETQAALTQRRVAVKAAAREETAIQLAAQREQAAAEKQRMAEMKAALRQRVIAVKAAAREETNALRAAQREQAQAQMQANRAAGIGRLMGGASQLAGAFGIGLGVAGVVQAGRGVVEATQLATAYDRQQIAAVNLAGSQEKLNSLLDAYARASGGAIDKATALADVTRLQATGFGKTAVELERFVRGARGASIAMGKPQDYIIQEVQLAIANTSFRRLDQIGLGIAEVNERMGELRATNSEMTREMAFSEAVLGLLNEKFGSLTTSVKGQATGVERLAAAWTNLRLEQGKAAGGTVNQSAGWLADRLEFLTKVEEARRKASESGNFEPPSDATPAQRRGAEKAAMQRDVSAANNRDWDALAHGWIALRTALGIGGATVTMYNAQKFLERDRPTYGPRGDSGYDGGSSSTFTYDRFGGEQGQDQLAAIVDRNRSLLAIDRSANAEILAQTTQYNAQRASTIASFEKSIAREAQDFARRRLNAERKLGLSILDVHQDSARQRVRAEADLERSISDARADRDERIGQARVDSAERVAEIEEKFTKDEEKRSRDHRKRLREAAANLDAVAVREEQLRYREETKERKDAHQEQLDDEGKSLQKRIDEANKAFAKQEADQRDALQRRFDRQAEDDALRIEQMKQAFADQIVEEDAERAIMVARRLEDHQAQLTELDTQHEARIQQIKDQAQAERDQTEEDFQATMDAAGSRTKAYEDMLQRRENAAIASFDRFYGHIDKKLGGTGIIAPPGHPSLADPYVDRAIPTGYNYVPPPLPPGAGSIQTSSRSVSVGDVSVTVLGGTNMNESQLYDVVYRAIANVMEDTA